MSGKYHSCGIPVHRIICSGTRNRGFRVVSTTIHVEQLFMADFERVIALDLLRISRFPR